MIEEDIALFKRLSLLFSIVFLFVGCGNQTKDGLFAEGRKLLDEGKPMRSIVYFKNALEKDQNFTDARFYLGKAYRSAGKYEQAEKEFLKVLKQEPSKKETHLELARVYLKTGKSDDALREGKISLESNPSDADILALLGQVFLQKNDAKEAEEYLQKALSIKSDLAAAKLTLAAVYLQKGDQQGAKSQIEQVIARDNKNTQAYYMRAEIEKKAGDSNAAIASYAKIAEIDPSDANASFMVGMMHLEKGDLKKARAVAEDLKKKFPKFSDSERLLGFIAYQEKKFDDAITSFQTALKTGENPVIYYYLGLSYYNKRQVEQALSQFQRALNLYPSFIQARLMTSVIFLTKKRADDALREAQKVLEADEKNALAHNIAGSAYMAKGMYEEAMVEMNKATESDPNYVNAYLKKGLFEISRGKVREAETELKAAVQIAPNALNTRFLLYSYYVKMKDYEKAVKTLKEGLDGTKKDAPLYNNIAVTLLAKNRSGDAEAIGYLKKAKETDPDYLPSYFSAATYYAGKSQYDKVLSEYEAVLKKDPKNLKALLSMASTFEVTGKNEQAFSYYVKAKETGKPEGFVALSGFYFRKKDHEKAVSVLDEALKTDPKNISAMELKGKIYLADKRYKDALRTFENVERTNLERGTNLIVLTYLAARDYDNAIRKLQERTKTAPQRLDLMNETARIYCLKGDTNKAFDIANTIIKQKPDSAYGYTVLAYVYEQQRELDKAIGALKKGLQVQGDNPQISLKIAELHTRKKEFGLSLKDYEDILKKQQGYVPALFGRATTLELMGKKKEAIKGYSDVLERSENHVLALNNLAFLYADGNGNKAEALKLANKAFGLAPNDGSVIDTLGYALLVNGKINEATKALEKAITLLPDNPSVRYHLALAYRQAGKKDKAKEQVVAALAKSDFSESAQAKKLLQEINGK
ncbi:TPR domain lipoprotein [Candidatus Sulfobium mesophilum]|uniref:TPR domain lipoprotein n=1 Tax=Candidatus Sulfobium mesophilum TaxID=2016548 RepID=A0A2U3QDT7_9BACT|nr:TPR domain lipoprotein [Candidatus Sulfobium mesophilum]